MEKERQRMPKSVMKLVVKLTGLFGLGNYDRSCSYPTKDDNNIVVDIAIEEDYQRIHIKFYPLFFTQSHQRQRKYLLHEFSHTVTHELVDLCDKMASGTFISRDQVKMGCERTTSKAAAIIENLLLGYEPDATKAFRTFGRKPVKKKRLSKRK